MKKSKLSYQTCEIAVIGGGVAGLYAGARIQEHLNQSSNSRQLRVIIIEKEKKIGGRLKSEFFKGMKHIPIEHGAMRFSKDHKLVNSLIHDLKLKTDKFNYEQAGYILRGKKCRPNIAKDFQNIYNFHSWERNKCPKDLMEYAIEISFEELEEGFTEKSKEEKESLIQNLININRYKDIRLNEINWSTFLFEALSVEAISLIKSAEGYNSNLDNISACEAMRDLYRLESEEFLYLTEGYQTLVTKLSERFKKNNGIIKCSAQLIEFQKNIENETDEYAERMFKQFSKSKPKPEYFLKFKSKDCIEYLFCNKIILAIPKLPIKSINRVSEFFNEKKGLSDMRLNRVQEMKSLKIYMHFERDPWKKFKLAGKKIYTDGIIRMIYFLDNKNADTEESIVLVYVDQSAIHEMALPEAHFKSAGKKIKPEHDFFIKHIAKNIEDLIRIFKNNPKWEIPKVKNIAYSFWEEAYHSFIPYVRTGKFIKEIIKPVDGYDVFICGSAYSSKQSWVEGALLTTEYMLQEYFDLSQFDPNLQDYIKDNVSW